MNGSGMSKHISCRIGCGACCIAPSLSSPLPGMAEGKPAGVRCPHLTVDNRCAVYGQPNRPVVCDSYKATEEFCGKNREDALMLLARLEKMTAAVPETPAFPPCGAQEKA